MTNDKDRTDAAVVTWRTAWGEGHRIRIEPRETDGTRDAYDRVEERFVEGRWQETGREVVTHVDIEVPEDSSFLSLFPNSQTEGNDGRI